MLNRSTEGQINKPGWAGDAVTFREQQIWELLITLGLDHNSLTIRRLGSPTMPGQAHLFEIIHGPRLGSSPGAKFCLKAFLGNPVEVPEDLRPGLIEYNNMRMVHSQVFGVPRPIDYLPEIDGILMEFVEGVELKRHLQLRLFAPCFPRVLDESKVTLKDTGLWLRKFQESDAGQPKQISLGEIVAADCASILMPGLVDLEVTMIDRLRRWFDGHSGLELDLVAAHGDFRPRNQMLHRAGKDRFLYVLDWKSYRLNHQLHDLHYMTVNILSWASIPGVSVRKAREFGDAVENGYFKGEPNRDPVYWLTRAVQLIYRARRSKAFQPPLVEFATVRKWKRVVNAELERCIDAVN